MTVEGNLIEMKINNNQAWCFLALSFDQNKNAQRSQNDILGKEKDCN